MRRLGELRVGVDGAADLGDTGRVGDGEVALAGERDGAGNRKLAALVGCEDFLVAERGYGSAGEVGSAGMVVSVDTSLSPGAHRGRTAHGGSSTGMLKMVWEHSAGPRVAGRGEAPELLACGRPVSCNGKQDRRPAKCRQATARSIVKRLSRAFGELISPKIADFAAKTDSAGLDQLRACGRDSSEQAFFRSSSASNSDNRRQRTAWTSPVTVSSRTRETAASPLTPRHRLLGNSVDVAEQAGGVRVLDVDRPVQALLHGRLHQAHVEDLHHHARRGRGRAPSPRRVRRRRPSARPLCCSSRQSSRAACGRAPASAGWGKGNSGTGFPAERPPGPPPRRAPRSRGLCARIRRRPRESGCSGAAAGAGWAEGPSAEDLSEIQASAAFRGRFSRQPGGLPPRRCRGNRRPLYGTAAPGGPGTEGAGRVLSGRSRCRTGPGLAAQSTPLILTTNTAPSRPITAAATYSET